MKLDLLFAKSNYSIMHKVMSKLNVINYINLHSHGFFIPDFTVLMEPILVPFLIS